MQTTTGVRCGDGLAVDADLVRLRAAGEDDGQVGHLPVQGGQGLGRRRLRGRHQVGVDGKAVAAPDAGGLQPPILAVRTPLGKRPNGT